MKHRFSFVSVLLMVCISVFAAVEPSVTLTDYYKDADGKSGQELRLALRSAIDHHSNVTYNKLCYLMVYSDTKDADGTTLIDIYSDCDYSTEIYNNRVNWISGGALGAGLNREHTVPQSWFGKADPMVADAFHIYPTDAKSNNHRSSYLYGEVYPKGTGESYSNDGHKELGALGTTYSSSDLAASEYQYDGVTYQLSSYTGTVYEPADEYKGDLARGIFYMATRYASPEANDGTDCSTWQNGSNPSHFGAGANDKFGLTEYSYKLLLKWHRQDPVSEKERLRNEVIYGNPTYNLSNYKQGNRNPFIDYPELVEYIWGNKAGQSMDLSKLVSSYSNGSQQQNTSTLTLSESAADFGTVILNGEVEKEFTVSFTGLQYLPGTRLAGGNADQFKLYVNGTLVTTATAEIPGVQDPDSKKYSGTATLKVVYNPSVQGIHSATLQTWYGASIQRNAKLKGVCGKSRLVRWVVDGKIIKTEEVLDKSKVEALPDEPSAPTNCGDKVFVGWARYEQTTETDTKPATLFDKVEDVPVVSDDYAFYYAVFATKNTGGANSVVEFLPEDFTGQGSTPDGSSMSATKGDVTLSFDKAYGTIQMRSYSGGSFSIESAYTLSKISITTNSEKGDAESISLKSNVGSYSATGTNGEWLGSANKVELTNSEKQVRILSVSVSLTADSYSGYVTRCTPYYTYYFDEDPEDESNYIYEVEVREGDIPVFPYGDPYKSSTQEWEYDFDKWTPTIEAASADNAGRTYVASYTKTKIQYEVFFSVMYGDWVPSQMVDYGGHVTKPADPVFDCKARHFTGWFSDPGYSMPFDFKNTIITDHMELYGGSELSGDVVYIVEHERMYGADMLVEYDTLKYTIPANTIEEQAMITLTPRNYLGYNTQYVMLDNMLMFCEDTMRFHINYSNNEHVLNWITDGDPLTSDVGIDYTFLPFEHMMYGSEVTEPNTPTKTGCIFIGWSDGKDIVTPETTMPDHDLIYTAVFMPVVELAFNIVSLDINDTKTTDELWSTLGAFNLSFDESDCMSWESVYKKGLFKKGVTVSLTLANGAYTLDHFEVNGTIDNNLTMPRNFKLDENTNITVFVSPTQYKLQVNSNNEFAGTASISGFTQFYASQLVDPNFGGVTLKATIADDSYVFYGWVNANVLSDQMKAEDLLDEYKLNYQELVGIYNTLSDVDKAAYKPLVDMYGKLFATQGTLTGTDLMFMEQMGWLVPDKNGVVTIQAVFVKDTPSDLDKTNTITNPAKIIRNGQVYIQLPDGKIYNILGSKVQ